MGKNKHPEEDQQKLFVKKVKAEYPEGSPEEVLITCSPAGFKMPRSLRFIFSQWARAMGYMPGTSDVLILEARGPYHGLLIEFKRPGGGSKSKAQRIFQTKASARGYAVSVAHSAEYALKLLKKYLSLEKRI